MFTIKKYNYLFFTLIAHVGLLLIPACSFLSPEKSNSDKFIVGTNSGFPPYEILNDHGKLEGFDIELAHLIAKKLGKELVIQDQSFDSLIVSLQQGKIDAIISGMSITPSRTEEISMVHYYGTAMTAFPLAFWNEIPTGISSILDLEKQDNKTVCVQAGNIQENFLADYSFIHIKQLDVIADLIMEIKYNKAIACALDPHVIASLKKQFPQIQILNVPLPSNHQNLGNGIGIKKENTSLTEQITKIMAELKKDETIKQLATKWFGEEVS